MEHTKLYLTQAKMKEALEYWLNGKVLQEPADVFSVSPEHKSSPWAFTVEYREREDLQKEVTLGHPDVPATGG